MTSVQHQENTNAESRVFRFSPSKRVSSSSSTTGLLSFSHESPPPPHIQPMARTRSFTHRNRVLIHALPSSNPGSRPGSFISREINLSSSRNDVIHSNSNGEWRHSEVFSPSSANVDTNQSVQVHRGRTPTTRSFRQHHVRSSSLGTSATYFSRVSSGSESATPLSVQHSSLAEAALHAPRISRNSSRRSYGEEWTRHHWNKVKTLEEASERARRCSKLSSGFAPLMVFGGLVFVCIGISASTNTGKDKERLQNLSAAPLAMGIFMIALGTLLIVTWFACRARSHKLNERLLHGSRLDLNSSQGNLVQAVVTKLYNQLERTNTARQPPSGSTPVLQRVSAPVPVYQMPEQKSPVTERNIARANQTQQQRTENNTLVSIETSV